MDKISPHDFERKGHDGEVYRRYEAGEAAEESRGEQRMERKRKRVRSSGDGGNIRQKNQRSGEFGAAAKTPSCRGLGGRRLHPWAAFR